MKRLGFSGGGGGSCSLTDALRSMSDIAVVALPGPNEDCNSDTFGNSSEHIRRIGSSGSLGRDQILEQSKNANYTPLLPRRHLNDVRKY